MKALKSWRFALLVIGYALALTLIACSAEYTPPAIVQTYSKNELRLAQDGKAESVEVIELEMACNPGYYPSAGHVSGHIMVFCNKVKQP